MNAILMFTVDSIDHMLGHSQHIYFCNVAKWVQQDKIAYCTEFYPSGIDCKNMHFILRTVIGDFGGKVKK